MITTTSIRFSYPDTSFHFPDIHCEAGHTLLVTGRSGTGKTTLLHLLAGILSPQSGDITINGVSLPSLSSSHRDKFRGENIGIVFQQSHFIKAFNVVENLLLAQQLGTGHTNKKQVLQLLENLQLEKMAKRKTTTLSQGQQQRISIARALVNKPQLLLADEPTSSLDDESCYNVARLLQQQAAQNKAALIIVTHDQRLRNIFHSVIDLT